MDMDGSNKFPMFAEGTHTQEGQASWKDQQGDDMLNDKALVHFYNFSDKEHSFKSKFTNTIATTAIGETSTGDWTSL